MPLAILKVFFLYDRLDSGHCSADHVLMDSARFGCRSLSSWRVVLMALLLKGARAEKARFQIFRHWGIARAHFLKRVDGSAILAFSKIIMGGKLFISPSLLHVKKERGARAARAPHLAISAICSGLHLAWGRIFAPGNT